MAKADYQKLNQPIRSIIRIIYATQWSMKGFRATLRTVEAFRQELLLFIFLAPLGIWLGDIGVEQALLIGSLS